jgi:hypothetical protein
MMIFSSICWYGFLVFYIGFKGAQEIKALIRNFETRNEKKEADS